MSDLMNGDTEYPTSKDTTTLMTSDDQAISDHINGPAQAIIAIQNELGVGLKGSLADLAARLNVNMSSEGGVLYGTQFPTSPPATPHFFWRVDLEKAYIYDTLLATYSEMATSVSLADYVSKSVGGTITAVHQFSPVATGSPFTIGANGTGQKVVGLNADQVDGKHAGTASGVATLTANTRVYEAAEALWDGVAGRAASPTVVPNTIPVRDVNGKLSADLQVYKSTPQTITSAGALQLTHGLTGITSPELVDVKVYLQCQSADGNYTAGDIIPVSTVYNFASYTYPNPSSVNASVGCSVVIDATYLNIRFANQGTTGMWYLPNKTTGAVFAIVNSLWKVIFVARY